MVAALKNPKRVLFIGAGGDILADINEKNTAEIAAKLPAGRAETLKLNLFDAEALKDAIQGASLVVLGAGLYSRTSAPVLAACLAAQVPYLDYDDDVESTQAALDLHEKAKKQNVPCYIGCGASPGMSNVMVMDVAKDLDTIDSLDICWLVGDECGHAGKAVLEHLMHIAAGPCLTWKNGQAVVNETWEETTYAPIVPGAADVLLHETAHPEPVTLPRHFAKANRIRCVGGLDPAPYNGIARGLGAAVRTGRLPIAVAVDFLFDLINKPPSTEGWGQAWASLTQAFKGGKITLNELLQLASHTSDALSPWRYAIQGMLDQIKSGECTTMEVIGFIISQARGTPAPYRSGLLVRAVGTHNGHPAVSMRRQPNPSKDSFLGQSMGAITGASCAAFMLMAIDQARESKGGVFCPEDWAQPQVFYKALQRLGCPPDQIVESL
ncbi:hypothetical protein LTR84_003678 [Exophiala bonariae]|uniref:Saccharopine dehydrogenase NADP binding domain-containing protein n=1 Tax=Exophiala bonariae TaxID=1690606 RepID=A0AAV9N600_9EURO|nr:hypothetical protein LTR84_003678 [Exophiala bonariae]